MGASRVEIVHSLTSASLAPPEYDIVVYEDAAVPASLIKNLAKVHAETIIKTKSWMTDCVISGELRP